MITCQLCKKQFKAISTTHLRRIHNISFSEYMDQFPDEPLCSPETAKKRKITLDNFKEKYGETEGINRWNEYCKKQSITNTFQYKNEK